MKLTIEIADHKADFFLELLKSFEDFVQVKEKGKVSEMELSEAHKKIIDERLGSFEKNPSAVLKWEDVEQQIEQSL